MAIVFEGVKIETEPGAMLSLACGDHDLVKGVFEIGESYTCREADCGAETTIVDQLVTEIIPVTEIA